MAYVLQLSDIHLHRDPGRRVGDQLPDERLASVVTAAHDRFRRIRKASSDALSETMASLEVAPPLGRRLPGVANAAGVDLSDASAPALVLLTGDLAEDGSAAAYRRLRAALAAFDGTPVMAIPGNHDDPAVLAEELPTAWSVGLGRWSVIGADTTIPGEIHGELGPDRRAALLDAIDATDATGPEHVLVALHHPPEPGCACAWFQLGDGGALLAELAGRPRVRAVVSGHLHHAFDRDHGPVRLFGAPGVLNAYRHGPPTHEPDPHGPAGARILHLHDDGTITTMVVVA